MATQAQISANRRNAAKSTGPRTTMGKALVAQNALKHGLLARQNVVMGEDPQQFELCRRQWLDEIRPVGNGETTLAERIAGLTWRLRRAERLQNEVFDCLLTEELYDSMEDFDDELTAEDVQNLASDPQTDPALAVGRMLKRDYAHERALERLMMLERWIESSLYKTMKELRGTQQARRAGGGDGAGVSEAACPRFEGTTPSTPQTPCGVTTNEDDSAKQSQSEGVSSLKCEVSSGAGSVPEDSRSCETKPIDPAEPVRSVPARVLEEAPSATCEAPSGDLALQTSHLTRDTFRQTPCGVTTNEADSVKQSQSVVEEGGHSRLCEDDSAKQSQSARPASGVRVLPRAVRRVAWHYHNVPRSY